MIDLLRLMRPLQWYKNLLIFLPIFFSQELFNHTYLLMTVIGFFSLSLMSSTNYIINDIVDRKHDRKNPEKKHRPIAAGRISLFSSALLALCTAALSMLLGWFLGPLFVAAVLSLFGLTQVYSFFLKDEAVMDVIIISLNFVIRAVSGALAIDVDISRWLVVGTFFLAFFLAISKRVSELKTLGDKAARHRRVYRYYQRDMMQAMLVISTTLLLISYLLFSLFSEHEHLFLSLPVVVYPLFRFFYLIEKGSPIPRHLELMYTDTRLWAGILFSVVVIFLLLYVI